ncbi:MAG: insulinase family protein, partial [Lachnospiraceae bacterium]|nr:insulinase family protein [Lachnospiraceae bacterium]
MEKSLIPSEYALIKQEYIPDCKGTGYLLKHKKSGARISVISNDDNNKVFCIAFRTPPKDNTGVAHILEHSVLCGSRKFKPKDPFMELEEGSLNTYLNALTFPDKTCYPVASCNMQDFANLMDVYLDAVFYPAIYEKEEIFRQEGWHYEVDENGELGLNGIVYSEMKGAFSS